ncbi:hypothetical protein BGZ65_000732 [Modicella reniformis]|uniref:FAM50A/XAP5 C-terminal domain-containing protein n=1 Tax=Modicella reniformis TaxID=1440133 RepID=A0A9P6SP36_9FUNG|nr:hypothetical protein BGZ65_000732 [Modicella reniformis]
MAEYKGTSQEGARHQKLEKQREKMMSDFEQQRAQITKDNEVKVSADKFVVQHDNVEEALKKSTIGLVHLKDFRKVRQELEELKKREAAKTNELQEKVVKKKTKKTISKLSFAEDEDEEGAQEDQDSKSSKKHTKSEDSMNEDEESPNNNRSSNKSSQSVFKKPKFGKDPNIDTSFLPDREREEEERRVREELRQDWIKKQEEIKKEPIQITYSYWDGSGHRKEVECKKGDTIAQFLEKCRQQFQQLRGVSIDNLMYVKEDLIIPHHYTFYDFIINKARGKSGPLFSFDVHEDIRLTNDANVEKDESHAGKVVERSYYERNKHIFPLSRFEIYDPEKTYGNISVLPHPQINSFAAMDSIIAPATASEGETATTTPTEPTGPAGHTTVTTPSWMLWQFLDSALPTGGFIASNGLEAFAKLHPDQTSPRHIEAYVNWSVHSCGYTNLPFVTVVWKLVDEWTVRDSQLKTERGKERAMKSVLHRIGNLDREYDVFMNNAIQNAASRKQGDGIVMMGVKCFAEQLNHNSKGAGGQGESDREGSENDHNELGPSIRILKPFKAMLRGEEIAGHYPIAFAMIARLLGFDLATTRYLHLHLHARTLLSSAIRLALVGPFQAQHIMTRSQAKARFIDAKTSDLTVEDAAQTFLVGDICAGVHGRLWSRLFNS